MRALNQRWTPQLRSPFLKRVLGGQKLEATFKASKKSIPETRKKGIPLHLLAEKYGRLNVLDPNTENS